MESDDRSSADERPRAAAPSFRRALLVGLVAVLVAAVGAAVWMLPDRRGDSGAEQLVVQAKVSRAAEVFATGVSDLDPDSATALVAGTFTDTYEVKGRARPQEPVPYRIEVSLVKIDGDWLVDDFTPVTGGQE